MPNDAEVRSSDRHLSDLQVAISGVWTTAARQGRAWTNAAITVSCIRHVTGSAEAPTRAFPFGTPLGLLTLTSTDSSAGSYRRRSTSGAPARRLGRPTAYQHPPEAFHSLGRVPCSATDATTASTSGVAIGCTIRRI